MSAADYATDYDAIRMHLDCFSHAPFVPVVTHHPNPGEDLDALQKQAEEAARLLGMGEPCEVCAQPGYEHISTRCDGGCHGTGWLNDSDTPAIDRLAMCDLKVLDKSHFVDVDGVIRPAPTYALPTAPCEHCAGTGQGSGSYCPDRLDEAHAAIYHAVAVQRAPLTGEVDWQ